MCFSAAASFSTAGLLVPVGLVCLQRCRASAASRWRPLAAIPLLFAAQQALEGFIWLDLARVGSPWHSPLSLAYLFFAYALWPAWIPWSALCGARGQVGARRARLLQLLQAAGLMLGLSLWLPVLLAPASAGPVLRAGSLHYGAVDALQATPLAGFGPVLYLALIVLPLLLVPQSALHWFALSLSLAALLSELWWQHAFSSVWCFFSALLSLQVLAVLRPMSSDIRFWSSGDTKTGPPDGLLMGA